VSSYGSNFTDLHPFLREFELPKISKRELAFGIAMNFHEDQLDLAGAPYIEHLLHVKNAVNDYGDDFAITESFTT
jgi:(p)ppGpp synthase/HD superfamily hydrolase